MGRAAGSLPASIETALPSNRLDISSSEPSEIFDRRGRQCGAPGRGDFGQPMVMVMPPTFAVGNNHGRSGGVERHRTAGAANAAAWVSHRRPFSASLRRTRRPALPACREQLRQHLADPRVVPTQRRLQPVRRAVRHRSLSSSTTIGAGMSPTRSCAASAGPAPRTALHVSAVKRRGWRRTARSPAHRGVRKSTMVSIVRISPSRSMRSRQRKPRRSCSAWAIRVNSLPVLGKIELDHVLQRQRDRRQQTRRSRHPVRQHHRAREMTFHSRSLRAARRAAVPADRVGRRYRLYLGERFRRRGDQLLVEHRGGTGTGVGS